MGPMVYLCGALAIMNVVTYAGMVIHNKYAVAMAVGIEESRGVSVCNGRVGEIERAHNAKVVEGTREANRAADLVPDPPATDAELAALCKKSASCRSRGAL